MKPLRTRLQEARERLGIPWEVLKPTTLRRVLHEYGEPLVAEVRVYALEEIVAEKLRAILQHAQKLRERGWSRSRARDYYDLWRVLGSHQAQMTLNDFPSFLHEKCAVRDVTFTGTNDFFQEPMLSYVGRTWRQWLGPLVPDLPSFETVVRELRPQIEALLSGEGS